jgi:hypothetical protein
MPVLMQAEMLTLSWQQQRKGSLRLAAITKISCKALQIREENRWRKRGEAAKMQNLLWEQGGGNSNPLAPTIQR